MTPQEFVKKWTPQGQSMQGRSELIEESHSMT